jgi:hypothetical protein
MSFFAWLNTWQRRLSVEPKRTNRLSKIRLDVENLESRNLLSTTSQTVLLGSQFALMATGGSPITNPTSTSPGTPTGPVTSPTQPTSPTGPIGTPTVSASVAFLGSHQLRDLVKSYAMAYTQSLQPGSSKSVVDDFLASQTRSFEFSRVINALGGSVDRVLITVRSTNAPGALASLETALQGIGMTVNSVHPFYEQLTGYIPIMKLPSLVNLPGYFSAVPVYKPFAKTGKVESEGDPVILGPTYRATTGFRGNGVTVGILSDSVNQAGGKVKSSQMTGDLPPVLQILKDGPTGSTDEGRAMLEIVHDVAPAANLAFYSGDFGPADFANGIESLANAGAKVIADDLGYFDSPMFNDGLVARAANDVVFNRGDFYASAAGNSGSAGWIHAFNGIDATVGGISGTWEDVGNGTPLQAITVANGGVIHLDFQWDAAYLEGGAPTFFKNFQVPNNLDIYVVDTTPGSANFGQIVGGSTDINQNTGEAFENLVFANGSADTQFSLAYQLVSGPAPTMLRWVSIEDGDDPLADGEGAPTTFGQPAAAGAVAVGAAHWTTPNVPEPFTSQGGPLPFEFNNNGNRLTTPQIRNKPEVTGPDGVSTTFFGQPDPTTGQKFAFFGTSAATPHVAGAAALYFSQAPKASPDDVRLALERSATDIPPTGFDNLTGFGMIRLTGIKLNQFGPGTIQGNDSSNTAFNAGVLAANSSSEFDGQVIKNQIGLPDYDWFKWTMGASGTFTSTVERTEGGTLELHAFTIINGILTELKKDVSPNAKFHTVTFNVTAGETIYLEVKGAMTSPGSLDQGVYNLSVKLV